MMKHSMWSQRIFVDFWNYYWNFKIMSQRREWNMCGTVPYCCDSEVLVLRRVSTLGEYMCFFWSCMWLMLVSISFGVMCCFCPTFSDFSNHICICTFVCSWIELWRMVHDLIWTELNWFSLWTINQSSVFLIWFLLKCHASASNQLM